MAGQRKTRLQLFFTAYIACTVISCVLLTLDRLGAAPRVENDTEIHDLYTQLRDASTAMDDAKIESLVERISARKSALKKSGFISRYLDVNLFKMPFFFGKTLEFSGWKLLGSLGALLFAGRWVVQLVYARRAGKPVTPITFWIMSLVGSNLTLMYFIYSPKQDMVGVLGNFLPTFVAAYNLFLEIRNRTRDQDANAAARMPSQKDEKKKDILPLSAQPVPAAE
jgi:lipid-A-disaccharide synthase-like uncharacterized protein